MEEFDDGYESYFLPSRRVLNRKLYHLGYCLNWSKFYVGFVKDLVGLIKSWITSLGMLRSERFDHSPNDMISNIVTA